MTSPAALAGTGPEPPISNLALGSAENKHDPQITETPTDDMQCPVMQGQNDAEPFESRVYPVGPTVDERHRTNHRTEKNIGQIRQSTTEPQSADIRQRKSRLRRMAVKLERFSSHRVFLDICNAQRLVPKGFRLKWRCHFAHPSHSEISPLINSILANAAAKLMEICLDLACKSEKKLETEIDTRMTELRSLIGAGEMIEFMDIISTDRETARLKLDRSKQKKLRQLREESSGVTHHHQQSHDSVGRGSSRSPPSAPGIVQRQLQRKHMSPVPASTVTPQDGAQASPNVVPEKRLTRQGAKSDTDAGTITNTEAGARQNHRTQGAHGVEVTNLSKRDLTSDEISLLSKGLNFVPTTKQSITRTKAQLKEWERLVRLREFWHNREDADSDNINTEDNTYKESKWTPPKGRDPCLDLYIEEVAREILQRSHRKVKGNLTKGEERALCDLIEDRSIIIRPADKGSGIVVMDADEYERQLHSEMQDGSTYRSTDSDQTRAVQAKVKNLAQNMHKRGIIGKHQLRYMIASNPQPGRLQGNPKLHKTGHPLRTIVSGRGHATERMAEIAEKELASHVEGQKSFIRDTTHFLRKLAQIPQPLPGGPCSPILFCMDVQKLYPSVPHKEGMEACRAALDQRSGSKIPTADVLKMIEIVLNNNNFTLHSNAHFIQTEGTAIGSKLGKIMHAHTWEDGRQNCTTDVPWHLSNICGSAMISGESG